MKNNMLRNIYKKAAVIGICAAAAFSSGCYLLPDEEEVLAPPTVKASEVTYTTVSAKKNDLEKKIVCTGTVTAERQYSLSYAKQSGAISKFYVKAGDEVKKGDIICEIDTYELDCQIEEKELSLEKARLNVDIIYEGGGTQAQIDSAYVDVKLIERELEKLKEQKEEAKLRSPINGVVSGLSDVRAGDSVNPGQTIATVIDTTALYIAIKPEDLTKFDIGTKLKIRINEDYYTGEVFMNPTKLAEYQEEKKEDHNDTDDTGIEYESDMIYVRFTDSVPTESVGQLADTILVLDSVKDAVIISNNLIKTVDGEKIVYVLKDGTKTAVKVETGLETGSQTEIKSGISEGDELILR